MKRGLSHTESTSPTRLLVGSGLHRANSQEVLEGAAASEQMWSSRQGAPSKGEDPDLDELRDVGGGGGCAPVRPPALSPSKLWKSSDHGTRSATAPVHYMTEEDLIPDAPRNMDEDEVPQCFFCGVVAANGCYKEDAGSSESYFSSLLTTDYFGASSPARG